MILTIKICLDFPAIWRLQAAGPGIDIIDISGV